jgi:hypothetical protein
MPRSPMGRAAPTYCGMNLPTFPLRPESKIPATVNGFRDASTDPDDARDWWNHNPDYNVGVCPWPDCAVVDVDVSGDKTGNDSFDALVAELGTFPPTWTAVTATGGRHIWLRLGADAIADRGVHKTIAPCIDVKIGATGYLVMPPSRTAAGAYRWLDPDRDGLPAGLPADAPEAWRERILKPVRRQPVGPPQPPAASGENPAYVAAAVAGELRKLAEAIPHGPKGTGRNDVLAAVSLRLFGLAKGGHVDQRAAEDEMHRIAQELGLGDAEINTVFKSTRERARPEHPPAVGVIEPAYSIDPRDRP